jgi:lipopolysaccharide export LptBFGC system permease protein LptF
MLASGLSLYRLIVPLIFAGIAVSGFCLAMNYKLAPHAEPSKKAIFDSLSAGKEKHYFSLLFRNRADSRTWLLQLKTNQLSPYTRAANIDLGTVESVHVTQQDKDGNILRKYYARGMSYDPATKTWTFTNGMAVNFNLNAAGYTDENWDTLKIKDWSETPWRIFSTDLEAENLSVPELRDYLRFNSDFSESQLAAYKTYYYYRWAVAASCLVVVFIAVPLGIVYSRRGVLVGVAGALFIFFGNIFFDKLFLALGKHGSIPPMFAGWGTNIIFGVVGLVMLYLRAGNHDLMKLHPKNLLHLFKPA